MVDAYELGRDQNCFGADMSPTANFARHTADGGNGRIATLALCHTE